MTATWHDYWGLTKPRIAFLVLVTAALGFFWGGQGIHAPLLFLLPARRHGSDHVRLVGASTSIWSAMSMV